ncbi:serine/threonine-protein phosphatase [Synechocystis sp. FACHB-383]|uniref:protein phosphatase 2C domain-containing protein n=1 Tax=Synechocystis sp. FACHB-383 TaxID=2692864 RepID=UPI0016877A9C|nr:serine/threonine-protein phosphatase [Synechocystis sp. FACHB-383]MBE9195546.1 serine/threonine-protein phosphatase [Synechocystis sp. LEGE 06083]
MTEVNLSVVSSSSTGQTDPGLVRQYNQDNFYLDPEGRFYIVADGMGGHAGGEEASRIAVERVRDYLDTYWRSEITSEQLLRDALMDANEGILEDQKINLERRDMGTTAVLIAFRDDGAWRAHVGDSRLYRLRNQQLERVTEDHTWVARALKMGDIDPTQAKAHPWRHVLFQCLGRQDLNFIEVEALDAQPGDTFLMCSDGLTEEVPDNLIEKILASQGDCDQQAAQLIEEAKNAGGSDNITIVLVDLAEDTPES